MASQDEEFRLETEIMDLRRLLAKAGIDAAEQEVATKLQHLIVEELHHRIKNMLATVTAITSQSLRAADTLQHAGKAIESRLAALGRVHDLLLQTHWTETTLSAVVKTAIEPYQTKAGEQFSVHTDNLKLAPNAVLPIAMVLNELCTNAVKYGALSNPSGRIEINGSIDNDARMLRLSWTEKNGPRVHEPKRRSFGSKLMEQAFVGPLRGSAKLEFAPTGVSYQLETPLAALSGNQ
jgi:two-component sensor histidine kinase